ncbi:hypothetical protein FNF29_00071 [Cafeteria roenbergensis]|uniref:EF-hand domain-containing protein n=1 Tax=Cafeteria roenbergensis TaxID=33653 RepID=A0A5A8CX04_CAFRO|nr:hypothetical protein FNF29_00071 [Cafeteria roenbergensis]|eukprot:KAA0157495.1 hypothetical protein FNF29_00071 [Cafeteria roenbergensis]
MFRSMPAMGRAAAAMAAAAVGAGATMGVAEAAPSRSEILQGEYENRLRRFANPEKLFEYFASVEDPDSGEPLMVPEDMVRALVPYNRLLGGRVGSPNPKFRFAARKEKSSPAVRDQYTADVAAVAASASTAGLASTPAASAAALSLLLARATGTVDNGTHLAALHAAGISHGALTDAVETLAGVTDDGCEGVEDPELGSAVVAELRRMKTWATFAAIVDSDGDGDVDFGEFVTALTLLELGRTATDDAPSLRLAFRTFDVNRNGQLEPAEGVEMLAALRRGSNVGAAVRDKSVAGTSQGRMAKAHTALLARMTSVGEPVEPATGATAGASSHRLLLPQVVGFRRRLRTALHRAEFEALDVDRSGRLSPAEFARLFASRVRPDMAEVIIRRAEAKIGGILAPVAPEAETSAEDGAEAGAEAGAGAGAGAEAGPEMGSSKAAAAKASRVAAQARDDATGCVTLEEMQVLDELLDHTAMLEVALRAAHHAEGGHAGLGVSRAGFRRATRAVLSSIPDRDGPCMLTETQENVIFALFDADGDGTLSAEELCGALRSAAGRELSRPRGWPLLRALARVPKCAMQAVGLGDDR